MLNDRLRIILNGYDSYFGAEAEKQVITITQFIEEQVRMGRSIESIREQLMADLQSENPRLFSQFRTSLRNGVWGAVNQAATAGNLEGLDVEADTLIRWHTNGVNVCPDCEIRHGEERTMAEWEFLGIPKSGFSVCQANCQCWLEPLGVPAGEIIRVGA